MSLTASKFNLTVQKAARKAENWNSDTIKLALFTAATAPAATDVTYATTLAGGSVEVATANGYTQGGFSLGAGITTNASGTEKMTTTSNFASPTLSSNTGDISLRYFVLFNSTSTNLLTFWDYLSTLVLHGANLDTLDLSSSNFNAGNGWGTFV